MDIKVNTLQIKQGLEVNLPSLLDGEFGLCTDTNKLYIGNTGNKELAFKTDLPKNTSELNNNSNFISSNATYSNLETTAKSIFTSINEVNALAKSLKTLLQSFIKKYDIQVSDWTKTDADVLYSKTITHNCDSTNIIVFGIDSDNDNILLSTNNTDNNNILIQSSDNKACSIFLLDLNKIINL